MKWSKYFFKAVFIAYLILSLQVAMAITCGDLRNYFQKSNLEDTDTKERLSQLQLMINENDYCAKNLLGRLEYQGIFVDKNIDNAKNIFIDLSNLGYPPAMFNLAYLQSEQKNSNPEAVLGLLAGIYATNLENKEFADLAKKSMEYGRNYIETLPEPMRTKLSNNFEVALGNANIAARNNRVERIKQSDEITYGVLGAVVGIGLGFMAGSRLASAAKGSTAAPAAASSTTSQPLPIFIMAPSGPGAYYGVPLR